MGEGGGKVLLGVGWGLGGKVPDPFLTCRDLLSGGKFGGFAQIESQHFALKLGKTVCENFFKGCTRAQGKHSKVRISFGLWLFLVRGDCTDYRENLENVAEPGDLLCQNVGRLGL